MSIIEAASCEGPLLAESRRMAKFAVEPCLLVDSLKPEPESRRRQATIVALVNLRRE